MFKFDNQTLVLLLVCLLCFVIGIIAKSAYDKLILKKTSENFIDNILNKNDDNMINNYINDGDFDNPLYKNATNETPALKNIMHEMDGTLDDWTKRRVGPNHSSSGRNVSYSNGDYRYDNVSEESRNKLNDMYDKALIFRNHDDSNNSEFTGFGDDSLGMYGTTQNEKFNNKELNAEEKVLDMFNTANYLPNAQLTDKRLQEGFQILDNPTDVTDTNLIPVMRASGTGTIIGCKRGMTRDPRGDVPIAKTVISPFNNSPTMPDIYASNRGRL